VLVVVIAQNNCTHGGQTGMFISSWQKSAKTDTKWGFALRLFQTTRRRLQSYLCRAQS